MVCQASSVPREGTVRQLLPILVLLCGIFLAHGLQCAAAGTHHAPAASTMLAALHSPAAHAAQAPSHASADPHPAQAAQPPADDGSALPPHVILTCVAVLFGIVLLSLFAKGRARIPRHRQLRESARQLLRTAQRWRPPTPALAVLCVSRT